MKKGLILVLFLIIPSFAWSTYVTDTTRVTFRTGPGNDHKIMMMINSGQQLTLLEKQEAWSRVRLPGGKEGWVMTRWLTDETPKGLLLEILEKKHDKLSAQYSALKEKADVLEKENKQLKTDLAVASKEARDCTTDYQALKASSAKFLDLKKNYAKSQEELEAMAGKLKILNDQLTTKNIWWFIAGAGILFFGIILGFSSRKKQRHSYL